MPMDKNESKIKRQDECVYCMTLLEMVGQHRDNNHVIEGIESNVSTYADLLAEIKHNTEYHQRRVQANKKA